MSTVNPEPTIVSLDKGTHYLCTCARSQNSPYCDGSHKGTQFQPLVLELEAPQTVEVTP
ncbi:CDGSH iron-sulfur domain-containing protein [Leptolyngbya sp. FACHB-261]|uniref:CDGSH iron-sulfur domain-containing protein n=1 Tax=Leptolyngbya sp. FACHB-261 TaxID=2692806 RepID=UPI001685934C|nr:CDGSH iron-sulfur domain-containing protein [Leptolyngbya sp. FACHB-261]MBD2100546.1 CDGSH iron-sulfur domain-containing protein [Leptolyngbya sp. FACHB-261]